MSFGVYILRRAVYALIVLFVIVSLNFVVFRMMPGDPLAGMLSPEFDQEAVALLMQQFQLDQPLSVQYVAYIKSLLRFDLGFSFTSRQPVLDELLDRVPNTLRLLGVAFLLNMSIGITVGIFAASRKGSLVEMFTIGSGLFAYAVPGFFLQLILLMVFGYYWPILPIRGSMSVPPPTEAWAFFFDRIRHMILPTISLVMIGFGSWALYTRNAMLEALGQDYILTARAKGLTQNRVLYRHAFRSILPPIVTIVFLNLPGIISGAVITETIFSWHGVGRYLLDSVLKQDYPAAQGSFYIIALAVLICNFAADIVYGFVDPRIRVGGGAKR